MNRLGPTSLAPEVEVFDLSDASTRLGPFTRRTRNIGISAGAGAVLIAIVVVLVSLPHITRGQMTGFNWFILGVFGFVAALGAATAVSDSLRRVPGASELKVSEVGVMLCYPDGRVVSQAWTDPGLDITVYDFSQSGSKSYRTPDFPFMLRDHGIDSLLTEGAFRALLDRAGRHASLEAPGPGTTWSYPADARPLTYRIVARPGAPFVTSREESPTKVSDLKS